MKSYVKILSLIILVSMLTGCWNNRDLTDLAIITGVAIDVPTDGGFEITVQIVKPDVLKSPGDEGGMEGKAYLNITSDGETMFDAIRNLLRKLNKKAFFSHVQLMVISEEAARKGLSNCFDFYERDPEARRRAYLLISKGMKAKTVLESESRLSKLPTTHNVEALETSNAFCKSLKVSLLDVLRNFDTEGYGLVLPILYNSKQTEKVFQEDLILEGSAVIDKGKLIGFLDPLQTRGFLFADDKVKSTIIVVPSPINENEKVSVEVVHSEGKISSSIMNGEPNLSIAVKAEGHIGEQQEKTDLTELEMVEAIEEAVQHKIEEEINSALKITQEEYQCDVFGFIKKLYRNNYLEWKEIVPEWSEIYSNLPVDVNVEFEIRRSGLIKEPTEPK